jgi:hypothetical protein
LIVTNSIFCHLFGVDHPITINNADAIIVYVGL